MAGQVVTIRLGGDTRCKCRCVLDDHKYEPETGETPCQGCKECDNFDEYTYVDQLGDDADDWWSAYKERF